MVTEFGLFSKGGGVSRWLTLQRLAIRLKGGNLFDYSMAFVDDRHGMQDFPFRISSYNFTTVAAYLDTPCRAPGTSRAYGKTVPSVSP